MLLKGKSTISIDYDKHQPGSPIKIIDQRGLPHFVNWETLTSTKDVAIAIKDMHLRGAPLIGGAAAFGAAFAIKESESASDFDKSLKDRFAMLAKTRPTAVNLAWALDEITKAISSQSNPQEMLAAAWAQADKIVANDISQCERIGKHGLELIKDIAKRKKGPVNILTHCNAGWLACLDWGTATSPIYHAQLEDIPVHVWVDETRPRNQGAKLTAFELEEQGIPYSVICDNTGGHLMQHGMVDLCIVGSDRTTLSGDVANKIGTYLKALAAKDNHVPFYVALPSSTFDPSIRDGLKDIPIETRSEAEVKTIDGLVDRTIKEVLVTPKNAKATNYGFDVTPARLISGLITERGICDANEHSIVAMYPEFNV